ncbi:MAG: nicotinate (nicotinamide) nucleotide adenylyltransferase [Acidobacteriaceae bacterium]|jgi:nicotinate-nucleotide adenylyltransferase
MRIALFGGTFDPIHRGHLAIASAAADAFALDRVLFAPVGRQPLKIEAPIASFSDRLAMVCLACSSAPPISQQGADPRFTASALDAPHPDGSPNFTVDSLAALALEYPSATLFVLTGADSFLDLRRWRAPDTLLSTAQWIVVSRPEFPVAELQLGALMLTPSQLAHVHLLATVHEEVSATELRSRLRSGDSCAGLLPTEVAAYIQTHHLYR